MQSFLMLPMQRITRLPLLVDVSFILECAKLRGLRGLRGLEKLRGSWVLGRG